MTTGPSFTMQVGTLPHFRHGVLKSMRSVRAGNRPMVWRRIRRVIPAFIGVGVVVVKVVTSGNVLANPSDTRIGMASGQATATAAVIGLVIGIFPPS
ncbi:MAG: hypothetical protein OXF79_16435 [Chloroflexi bacterium]|nr:hypothetical protein [Chloroflexota bacterium]